jgi:hypothetical protein
MPTPVRIIIDITDADGFDWEAASAYWKTRFNRNFSGYNSDLDYTWYKVNPSTNMPLIPLPPAVRARVLGVPPGSVQIVDHSADIEELREEIRAVERAVYHAKAAKEPIPMKTKTAMKNSVRKLYSRWAALDVITTALSAIADPSAIVETRVPMPDPEHIAQPETDAERRARNAAAQRARRARAAARTELDLNIRAMSGVIL